MDLHIHAPNLTWADFVDILLGACTDRTYLVQTCVNSSQMGNCYLPRENFSDPLLGFLHTW